MDNVSASLSTPSPIFTRRTLLKSALLLGVSGVLAKTAICQTEKPSKPPSPSLPNSPWVEEIARGIQAELNLPAIWMAVNIEDKIEAACLGVRKYGDQTPATLSDPLTVASVSKPMAGFWIASLVDEGKIDYQSRLLDVLPELADGCLPEHKDITLGQLLTHTAAVIRDANNIPNHLTLEQYPTERLRQARQLLTAPSPPDSVGKAVYSNNGVTLAVSMAERAVGESYEVAAGRFYRERLGLTSWGVWPMNLDDGLSLPWPHAMNNGTPEPRPPKGLQFQFVRPSGSAHCSITDLVRFGLLATEATADATDILKPETWADISEEAPNSFYTRACLAANSERFLFSHSGSLGTTRTNLYILPEWRTALAVHTNAGSDDASGRGMDLLLDAVWRQRTGKRAAPAARLTLTGVDTVDNTWNTPIIPRLSDDKIRIRVQFTIQVRNTTGDLQTLVKLGNVERRDNRFRGLVAGNHTLHFEFDTPKTKETPVLVKLDALGTGGNISGKAGVFDSMLTLQ